MRPLISIMMPCFNSASTLRMALGSLAAQTIRDWEAVCVDDGSTDDTWNILESAARKDARFKLHRFEQNKGRGAARQRALELATGTYLAFCDSDDWMYPDRLATHLRWFEADARIAAVSVAAAITDREGEIVGVQRPNGGSHLPQVSSFDRPRTPPLLFPASMIVLDLAKRTGFDPAFRRSQDSDFLIRALLGRHYALSPDVLYGYSQGAYASLERTLDGYRYRVRAHLKHVRSFPLPVARTLTLTGLKMASYRAAGLFGLDGKLIERRWSHDVATEERARFETARRVVQRATEDLFLAYGA